MTFGELFAMRAGKRRAAAILAGVVAATCVVAGPASSETSWSCFQHKKTERAFTKKMNRARVSRDLRRVYLDKQISEVARRHAAKMAAEHTVFHSNPDRLAEKVTKWRLLSENVGRGGTVSGTHEAFMSSSGHKENILRPSWKHVGVGTVRRDGVLYVAVVFESKRDPGTTLAPPTC